MDRMPYAALVDENRSRQSPHWTGFSTCFPRLFALTLFCLALPAFAGAAGTSGAQFLKLGVGARSVAMGEAFVAVANDASALFWNPAGLARLSSKELSASHHAYVQGINYDAVSYAHPSRVGTFATGMNYLQIGDIERRGTDEKPQGNFSASDAAFVLSYARPLLSSSGSRSPQSRMTGGVNLKIIRQDIDGYQAQAVAADFGLLTPLRNTRFTLGLALQNVGTDVRFANESYALPRTLRVGLSWSAAKAPLLLSGALSLPRDNAPSFQLGSEFWVTSMLALRSGYFLRAENDAAGFRGVSSNTDNGLARLVGLTAGVGLRFLNMQMDYALVPMGDLGTTHRVTLGFKFK